PSHWCSASFPTRRTSDLLAERQLRSPEAKRGDDRRQLGSRGRQPDQREADQRARHPRLLSYRIARLRQRITSGEDESPVERDEQPQARQCTWIVTSVLRPAFRCVFPRVELPWRAPVIPDRKSVV